MCLNGVNHRFLPAHLRGGQRRPPGGPSPSDWSIAGISPGLLSCACACSAAKSSPTHFLSARCPVGGGGGGSGSEKPQLRVCEEGCRPCRSGHGGTRSRRRASGCEAGSPSAAFAAPWPSSGWYVCRCCCLEKCSLFGAAGRAHCGAFQRGGKNWVAASLRVCSVGGQTAQLLMGEPPC